MKIFQSILDKFAPLFEKGGKFEKMYPLYEAGEGFLFVPAHRTKTGSHVRDPIDMKRLMITVYFALVPAFIIGMYNVGYQHFLSLGIQASFFQIIFKGAIVVLPIYIVVLATGGIWEVIFAVIRKHEVSEGFLITSFLVPLIVPPTVPLWMLVVATSFGIVIGKEIFGGVGMNIFNPAMVTRVFLFFAYPKAMSGNTVWTVFGEKLSSTYTAATPLAIVSDKVAANSSVVDALADKGYTLKSMFIGLIPGSIGETSTLAILIGMIFLLVTGIASWRIILSIAIGGVGMAFLLNLLSPSDAHILALPAHYHFVMGGFAFGAVFMATDPVTSCATNKGKWIFGILVGAIAIIVRTLTPDLFTNKVFLETLCADFGAKSRGFSLFVKCNSQHSIQI